MERAVVHRVAASAILLALLVVAQPVSSQEVVVTVTDLGTLGGAWSHAWGINAHGHVVGYSEPSGGPFEEYVSHAFLWTPDDGMIDLGTLGGTSSSAGFISDSGYVTGHSDTSEGERHAVLWSVYTGEMVDLGTLGGTMARAHKVNDLGQVVGWSLTADGSERAFFWTPETGMIDMGTLGGDRSWVNGLNNLGQAVGGSTTESGETRAFLWTLDDGMVELPTLYGGWTNGASINDLGQVVGDSSTPDGFSHAFLWTEEDGIQDLGTLGGAYSQVASINALGQVLGFRSETNEGGEHAWLWTAEDGMEDLDVLPGMVFSRNQGINNLGQVVGYSGPDYSGPWMWATGRPFLWTEETWTIELETLGGDTGAARRINDAGQIVGSSQTSSDDLHATLWTLQSSPPPPQEQLEALEDNIQLLSDVGALNDGQSTSFSQKAETIGKLLDKDKTTGACNLLEASANQVVASVKGGVMPAAAGSILTNALENLGNEICD
jgi:probable HAF family extracellular repeat protein